jgi:hypothetical protein
LIVGTRTARDSKEADGQDQKRNFFHNLEVTATPLCQSQQSKKKRRTELRAALEEETKAPVYRGA